MLPPTKSRRSSARLRAGGAAKESWGSANGEPRGGVGFVLRRVCGASERTCLPISIAHNIMIYNLIVRSKYKQLFACLNMNKSC